MSHTLHEAVNISDSGIGGGHLYPPQLAPAQAPQSVSNFVDGSGPIFSMYMEMATEEDKKMAENWKADADGILIFTGLFSAAVAPLISVSIQDIRQNPQDTSNFYLANIYQTLADPSVSIPPASPPPFSPPTYAVWVNSLWFLSLVISLTCALLAELPQTWARRYLKVTQTRYSPHKRARIRAFLAEGTEKLLLSWTVETLPALLHISLFLFFAGLVVLLWNVNLTIFKFALSWVGVCTALYGCITVMPIIRHDSPYHTPLSLPAWHIATGIRVLTFRAFRRLTYLSYFSIETHVHFDALARRYFKFLEQGIQRTFEETALNSPSEIDARAFLWTFDSLDEDHELERFFSGLPGFRSSKVVEDPLPGLAEEGKHRLFEALIGLLDRTLSSDLLPELVKSRRAMICKKSIDPALISFRVLRIIFSKYQYGGPLVADIVQIFGGWGNNRDEDNNLNVQATISMIVATVQPRDHPWYILASRLLGIPEVDLRDSAADGDSLSLAILIDVTRQQFSHFSKASWPRNEFSTVLEEASKFNVQDTSPELQHEFCALWNKIVRKVQNTNDSEMALDILGPIRNVYIALHRDTNSAITRFSALTTEFDLAEPSVYPLCNIPGHHSDSTNDVHHGSTSTAFAPAVPHDHANTALIPSYLSGSPIAPSSSSHPPHVNEILTEASLRNINISSVSLHTIDQTTTESPHIYATSPNSVKTRATHGSIDTSTITTHLSTPDPSVSTRAPKLKSSPPDTGAVKHTTDRRAPSGDLVVLSSASPTPVLDDIFSLGLLLSSDIQVIGSDHRSTSPESYTSMLAPDAPLSSSPSTSVPNLGVATVDEGNAGSRQNKDAPHTSLVIRENNMASPELPPRSSLLSVTGVGIAGPSGRRSLDTRHTGDHPPQPLHGQDNIV